MSGKRIAGLLAGSLIVLVAFGLLVAGGLLAAAATQRDDDGYVEVELRPIETPTYALSTQELDLGADPGPPGWLRGRADVSVRLRVSSVDGSPLFVGMAPADDVGRYLTGVAHDEIAEVDGRTVTALDRRDGTRAPSAPADEDFWVASASGPGTQEVIWDVESGRWTVVVMNADADAGVAVTAAVAARVGFLVPLAVTLVLLGLVGMATGIVLIWLSARDPGRVAPPAPVDLTGAPPPPVGPSPTPAGWEGEPSTPVRLQSRIDPALSRWQWLVKWFLAIPHLVILLFLWMAFVVLTVVAGVAILFTGRYPRGLFDFNVGVLRWTWRVVVYAFTGGVTTDAYPPFTLGPAPEYPATLDIAYPEQLSRGLVLVKWWLLAIPHYLVLAFVAGVGVGPWNAPDGTGNTAGAGLLGILTLIAAVTLLFTGRYPRSLFDLIVGLNRWVYRVIAYAALMTDRYPPFRLDQGGGEPAVAPPSGPTPGPPRTDAVERDLAATP